MIGNIVCIEGFRRNDLCYRVFNFCAHCRLDRIEVALLNFAVFVFCLKICTSCLHRFALEILCLYKHIADYGILARIYHSSANIRALHHKRGKEANPAGMRRISRKNFDIVVLVKDRIAKRGIYPCPLCIFFSPFTERICSDLGTAAQSSCQPVRQFCKAFPKEFVYKFACTFIRQTGNTTDQLFQCDFCGSIQCTVGHCIFHFVALGKGFITRSGKGRSRKHSASERRIEHAHNYGRCHVADCLGRFHCVFCLLVCICIQHRI